MMWILILIFFDSECIQDRVLIWKKATQLIF